MLAKIEALFLIPVNILQSDLIATKSIPDKQLATVLLIRDTYIQYRRSHEQGNRFNLFILFLANKQAPVNR